MHCSYHALHHTPNTSPPLQNDVLHCLHGIQSDADAEKIEALETDPRVAPSILLGYWRPANPNYKEDIKKRSQNGFCVTREGDEFIGVFGLGFKPDSDTPNRNPYAFITVSPEQQKKGYGVEMLRFLLKHAFVELGMHKVWLQVFSENAPAIALYHK